MCTEKSSQWYSENYVDYSITISEPHMCPKELPLPKVLVFKNYVDCYVFQLFILLLTLPLTLYVVVRLWDYLLRSSKDKMIPQKKEQAATKVLSKLKAIKVVAPRVDIIQVVKDVHLAATKVYQLQSKKANMNYSTSRHLWFVSSSNVFETSHSPMNSFINTHFNKFIPPIRKVLIDSIYRQARNEISETNAAEMVLGTWIDETTQLFTECIMISDNKLMFSPPINMKVVLNHKRKTISDEE